MKVEKKTLLIQTAFPGDAILTIPLIQELKKKNPAYIIDVLCRPSTADIFKASPYVSTVIPYDKKGKAKSPSAFIKLIKELKAKNYEAVYSPHRSLRSALIALNIGAKETVGFENSSLRFAFNNIVRYDASAHEVKRNLAFIGEYDGDDWLIIPELTISSEVKDKVQKFVSDNRIDKFITIAPGSVWETKKYPVEYYRQIIEHFVNSNYKIVLIGGSEDRLLCETLKGDNKENIYLVAGNFSFIETIELLKRTVLLICNDSAPTHLGMCADIPVLTIYCSTVPQFGFYPYNRKSDYVSYDELLCKPCGIHGYSRCPLGTFDCAKLLKPDKIIEKADQLLFNVFR